MKRLLLKGAVLGFLLLFNNSLVMGRFNLAIFSKLVAAPRQLFTLQNKSIPASQTIQIFNDLEDELEYVLNVDSLTELTDQLTVYANGILLVQDQLNTVPLPHETCSFSVQFPLRALLKVLKKEKMQLLLQTYEDTIRDYLKNNTNTYIRQFCTKHYKSSWFKLLLKIPKLEINFTYNVSEQDRKKQCLSLLVIVLKKKEELEKALEQGLTSGLLHYALPRTIVVTIKP